MYLSQVLFYLSMIIVPFFPGPAETPYDDARTYLNKTRAEVEYLIKDQGRANNAQYQLYLMSEEVNAFKKQFLEQGKEFARLYMTYESQPEDFEKVLARIDEERSNSQKQVLDACFRLRQTLTPEEWKAVFGPK
ncbi:MAG TPA: hypothetical protein PLT09_05225 [Deltaproteobacteria bacterium]|nr:hypothetical protein [Deltaproteobacteria bacterium]HPR54039.1 hypothetical protein [Deltaproteobacteria bacterium]HXK46819.1 hypothetical protein [Deltaproteobacteria bacterium]